MFELVDEKATVIRRVKNFRHFYPGLLDHEYDFELTHIKHLEVRPPLLSLCRRKTEKHHRGKPRHDLSHI